VELEFGHPGAREALGVADCVACFPNLGPDTQTFQYDTLREAWIQWDDLFGVASVRMGLVPLPTTRQLMTPPERQQFVDVSLASAWTGLGLPGYTDRNRDHGLLIHGAFGYDDEWTWMVSITNGDGGDGVRNVLDFRSSDNLAYGARLNYAPLGRIGYEEGALRQYTCRTVFEMGAWVFYYADRTDRPHVQEGDYLRWGLDAALGYGGFSLTAAVSWAIDRDVFGQFDDDSTAFLVQVGHHVPGTPIEVASRFSGYDTDGDLLGNGTTWEVAGAVNVYLDGHRNKVQVDVAWITTEDDGFLIVDPYAAYPGLLANEEDALLLRFQWQLAL
jgi:hypothetical protein